MTKRMTLLTQGFICTSICLLGGDLARAQGCSQRGSASASGTGSILTSPVTVLQSGQLAGIQQPQVASVAGLQPPAMSGALLMQQTATAAAMRRQSEAMAQAERRERQQQERA